MPSEKKTMIETHFRSLAKALSYRATGTIVTGTTAWLFTGSLDLAAKIGLLDAAIKILVFYAHERFWNGVNFGKQKPPDYQI